MLGVLRAEPPAPEPKDPLQRGTPQSSVVHFLEACHARDYRKAAHYLDLHNMTPADQSKMGPNLAKQLEDLLDDTPFDITTLSLDPEGDLSDGLSSARELLDRVHLDGKTLDLELERVQTKSGSHVWLVSAESVALIPEAHRLVGESPFEKKLPQPLVAFEILDTPVWRWLALILMAAVLWIVAGLITWALRAPMIRIAGSPAFGGPLRTGLVVTGLRFALTLTPPAPLPRLFIERALGLILSLTTAWAGAVVIDLLAQRWYARLDPRVQTISYSVLPLGRQILKVSLFIIAILGVAGAWGYNTSTILAGLGVGGLAVALAAQKTIENLFGGISVIGDRPVLVGDFCRFGDRVGTIAHIGLRSTRIRTPERTLISVPNAQFSSMMLENFSARDKIHFHTMLNLRRNTTSSQLLQVLESLQHILTDHPKVETGKIPVRFIGAGPYSLDVEVDVLVTTSDYDEFLALQQELQLKTLEAIEHAGTALAVPLQENIQPASASPAA